jgi:hypothetical protein
VKSNAKVEAAPFTENVKDAARAKSNVAKSHTAQKRREHPVKQGAPKTSAGIKISFFGRYVFCRRSASKDDFVDG